MAGNTGFTSADSPDWGAIEKGDFTTIASTMWLIYALVKQETINRQQDVLTRADQFRQDRVAMMGVYAP